MSTLYCAVHESEIGPSRTFLLSQRTSAFRGKADTKVLTFSTRCSAAQFANTKNPYCCSVPTLEANELANRLILGSSHLSLGSATGSLSRRFKLTSGICQFGGD